MEEVLAHGKQARAELDALTNSEARLEALTAELTQCEAELAAEAVALSKKRRELARRFEKAVSAQLSELAMERAQMEVSLERQPEAGRGEGRTALSSAVKALLKAQR